MGLGLGLGVIRVGVEDAEPRPQRRPHSVQPDLRRAAAAAAVVVVVVAVADGAVCGVAGVGADRKALRHSVGWQHLRAQRRWWNWRLWRRLARAPAAAAGRPVGRPLPGSAELPRAARRALRRHRGQAGALPRGAL
eukprot:scaffold110923_cov56-Phaeocystis_antarctica.AAC.2